MQLVKNLHQPNTTLRVARKSLVDYGIVALELEECGKDRPSDTATHDDDFGLRHEGLGDGCW